MEMGLDIGCKENKNWIIYGERTILKVEETGWWQPHIGEQQDKSSAGMKNVLKEVRKHILTCD